MFQLFDIVGAILDSQWGGWLIVGGGVALVVGVVLAPRMSVPAGESAATANISPLWAPASSLAVIVAFFVAASAQSKPLLVVPFALALLHIWIDGLILYRHRRWLWLALPLVLASLAFIVFATAVVALMGVWAQIGH